MYFNCLIASMWCRRVTISVMLSPCCSSGFGAFDLPLPLIGLPDEDCAVMLARRSAQMLAAVEIQEASGNAAGAL